MSRNDNNITIYTVITTVYYIIRVLSGHAEDVATLDPPRLRISSVLAPIAEPNETDGLTLTSDDR